MAVQGLHVYVSHKDAADSDNTAAGTISYANSVLTLNHFYARRVLDPIGRHKFEGANPAQENNTGFVTREDMGLHPDIHGTVGLNSDVCGYTAVSPSAVPPSYASIRTEYENKLIDNGFHERVARKGVTGSLFCKSISLRGLEDFSFRIMVKSSIHTNRMEESFYHDQRLRDLTVSAAEEDGGTYTKDAGDYGKTKYLRWFSGSLDVLSVELVLVPPTHTRFNDAVTHNQRRTASDWNPNKSDGDIS